MDTNNIFDANLLKEGQVIKLPETSNSYIIYTVKKGDSLNQLSRAYEIDKDEILKINNIINPNDIYIGQKIKIPSEAIREKDLKNKINTVDLLIPKVQKVGKKSGNEEISNTNLTSDEWKNYGPLKINLSSLEFKDGSFIANSIHQNGKPLFIAIKCSKRIINRTGLNGSWREWISPEEIFENELINDVCKN
tara:strand:- start:160 stop:735 length:576 start_codon:yes stop_codon:yes gene_type:complete